MVLTLNEQVQNLPKSGIRRFFDLVISAGPEVISLGVGEPDFPTPWHIREAAIFSLEKGFTSYTENAGLLELREAIAEKITKETGTQYDPKTEILITNGVSEGMDIAFRATINPGDTILLPDPGYVMYAPLVQLSGGKVNYYNPLDLSTLKDKEANGIVLNFPGNPIGNTFTKEDLLLIKKIAQERSWKIYSDEIYEGLTFNSQHLSLVSFSDIKTHTLLFDGLSKTHAMTGLRIGWIAGPSEIIQGINKIHQYSALCASSTSQLAALEALRRGGTEAKKMKDTYNKRRKFCIKRLQEMNLPFHEPQGAFYILVNISEHNSDDIQFCESLLEKEKLAVVPGSAFGSAGIGHIRMTYAASTTELEEAMNRLEKFVTK